MGLRPAELATMSLGEFEDQVKAWNAAQQDGPAELSDTETGALADWVDRMENAGHA